MRPDCFRLVVRSGQVTRYILAANEGRFWQQSSGQPAQGVSTPSLGERRYLSEFADPLFASEDYTFERLEDGTADGKKVHRIKVIRPDSSSYVARIDAESFRETGRENQDRSTARYSDFREIAGVTYAFREEITDATGHTGVLELTRISPNPGLIHDLFELPVRPDLSYFELENCLGPAASAGIKFN